VQVKARDVVEKRLGVGDDFGVWLPGRWTFQTEVGNGNESAKTELVPLETRVPNVEQRRPPGTTTASEMKENCWSVSDGGLKKSTISNFLLACRIRCG
jgi:hypothetical protein